VAQHAPELLLHLLRVPVLPPRARSLQPRSRHGIPGSSGHSSVCKHGVTNPARQGAHRGVGGFEAAGSNWFLCAGCLFNRRPPARSAITRPHRRRLPPAAARPTRQRREERATGAPQSHTGCFQQPHEAVETSSWQQNPCGQKKGKLNTSQCAHPQEGAQQTLI